MGSLGQVWWLSPEKRCMSAVLPGFSLGLQLCHFMASPCMGRRWSFDLAFLKSSKQEMPLSPEQFTSSSHLYGALVNAVHVTVKAKPFILRDVQPFSKHVGCIKFLDITLKNPNAFSQHHTLVCVQFAHNVVCLSM